MMAAITLPTRKQWLRTLAYGVAGGSVLLGSLAWLHLWKTRSGSAQTGEPVRLLNLTGLSQIAKSRRCASLGNVPKPPQSRGHAATTELA
ncbi:MAG: hypothetical protein ACN6P5_27195 [Pseudomonas protegens]|uniref:hypothetical protein n=1 Tax=Pseudomonas protegens TaxID=380021 RepID=UPI00383B498B